MSCATCGSCSDSSTSNLATLDQSIADALTNKHVPLSEREEQEWEMLCNDIGFALAGNHITAIRPLLSVFQLKGLDSYLKVAAHCVALNVHSLLLAWAFQHCSDDVDLFTNTLFDPARHTALIEFVNREAAIHECFAGNSPQPRAHAMQSCRAIDALRSHERTHAEP